MPGNLEEKHASVGKDLASGVKASLGSIAESAARLATGKIPPISATKRRELAARQVMIDIMILYTPKVARKYVDLETDLIALSIEQANESFASSGLGHIKLNLVHDQEVNTSRTSTRWSTERGRSLKFTVCGMKRGLTWSC